MYARAWFRQYEQVERDIASGILALVRDKRDCWRLAGRPMIGVPLALVSH